MQLAAGKIGNRLVFVFRHVIVADKPMLDAHLRLWANEKGGEHHQNMTAQRRQALI
jgi:hypothetical protein